MKIGIRLHDTAPGSLRERLHFARVQGFCCAHVALSKVLDDFVMEDAPEKLNRDCAARVLQDFRDTGMDCAVLGCYLNLADPNAERRAKTQEIYRAHLRFAALTGADVVGTETYANPDSVFSEPAARSEDAFRLFTESLKTVVRYAEEEDVILAVEPVYHHIISTPERAERMLEAVPSDHLQIILDAVNLIGPRTTNQVYDVIEDAIHRLGDRVRILHMKDFILLQNGEIRSCACGLGSMRYERLLAFAAERDLPIILEDTVPANAEEARMHLERFSGGVR